MRDPFVTISPAPSLFLRDAAVPAAALALLALVLLTQQNQALFLMINHVAARFPDALWARWTVLGDALLLLVLVLPWLGLASGVGLSRMAVGVHWPVDVLAGAAVGWTGACAALVRARRWRWGISPRGQRVTALLLLVAGGVMVWGYDTGYPDMALMQRLLALLSLAVAITGLVRVARSR